MCLYMTTPLNTAALRKPPPPRSSLLALASVMPVELVGLQPNAVPEDRYTNTAEGMNCKNLKRQRMLNNQSHCGQNSHFSSCQRCVFLSLPVKRRTRAPGPNPSQGLSSGCRTRMSERSGHETVGVLTRGWSQTNLVKRKYLVSALC